MLVDFYADWRGRCQVQGPIVDELATEYDGKAAIGKLDTEATMDIAKQYGVMSIPTIIIFRNVSRLNVWLEFRRKKFWPKA